MDAALLLTRARGCLPAEPFEPVLIVLIGETHMPPARRLPPPPPSFQFNWGGGSPLIRAHSQKATNVTIGISDLVQRRAGGGKHMFSIWTHAWLPPSPAKHNLSHVLRKRAKKAACLQHFPHRSKKVYIQGDGGCDVPRPKVERLRLARGLMQTFVFPQAFPLVTEGKNEEEEGHRLNLNLNFHLNATAQRVDIYSSTTV